MTDAHTGYDIWNEFELTPVRTDWVLITALSVHGGSGGTHRGFAEIEFYIGTSKSVVSLMCACMYTMYV